MCNIARGHVQSLAIDGTTSPASRFPGLPSPNVWPAPPPATSTTTQHMGDNTHHSCTTCAAEVHSAWLPGGCRACHQGRRVCALGCVAICTPVSFVHAYLGDSTSVSSALQRHQLRHHRHRACTARGVWNTRERWAVAVRISPAHHASHLLLVRGMTPIWLTAPACSLL